MAVTGLNFLFLLENNKENLNPTIDLESFIQNYLIGWLPLYQFLYEYVCSVLSTGRDLNRYSLHVLS